MIVRKTTPQETVRVNELFAIAFEQPMENGPAGQAEAGVCHWAAFEDGTGQMMSTFTVTDFSVQFDGNTCKMGGIGGVATLPNYRRKGGIRGCFQAALTDMYDRGYDFSYLYPFSTAYYRKFGYENCVRKLDVAVSLGLLAPVKTEGCCVLAEKGTDLTGAIRNLDGQWEARYNMMVQHTDKDYQWLAQQDPAKQQVFTYVYYSKRSEPKAYTTFRKEDQPDGRNLQCSRFCFADREGFTGLMELFKSLSSDHSYVKFSLPDEEAIPYLLPEWSMGTAQWKLQNGGMVRVINIPSVLWKARYRGSGQAVLRIKDPQIPQNNGGFRIQFKDGRAVSVEKTEQMPDAEMPVHVFSALICGVSNLESALRWMPETTAPGDRKALEGIFYRKPMMISDYF